MRSDPSAAAALYENAALRIIPPRLRNRRVGVGEKNATLCGRKLPSLFLHSNRAVKVWLALAASTLTA